MAEAVAVLDVHVELVKGLEKLRQAARVVGHGDGRDLDDLGAVASLAERLQGALRLAAHDAREAVLLVVGERWQSTTLMNWSPVSVTRMSERGARATAMPSRAHR
ncbi:MAG: hypothetical protein EGQ66_05570, partial [Coriobacteriaceae bacterium]|nr:hypothetical protein [Coriobacteriaceae bacterium]